MMQQELEDLRAFAQGMCIAAGDPGAMDRIVLGATATRLTYSTIDGPSCGATISGLLRPDRARIAVRTNLNRILRQRARDRALAASGEEGVPAWSVDIHAVALAALINGGVNPALIPLLGPMDMERNVLSRASEGTSIRIGKAGLCAGRVSISSITGGGPRADDTVVLYETSITREQVVMVRTQTHPDIVVDTMAGRRLGEIVEHPLLKGAETTRIAAVEPGDGILNLTLADERITLAPPPGGENWLRFPWVTIEIDH